MTGDQVRPALHSLLRQRNARPVFSGQPGAYMEEFLFY
jgi:hypothetical protein